MSGRLFLALFLVLAASGVASIAAGDSHSVRPGQWVGSPIAAFGADYWVCAHGLNDRGQVLGKYAGADMDEWMEGSQLGIWQDGVLRPLGIRAEDCEGDFNDRGQIVGSWRQVRGFLWSNGKTRPIDGLPYGLNNRAQVVGENRNTAFLWGGGRLQALATPKGKTSVALAINERGVAVGWVAPSAEAYPFYNGVPQRAALWRNGRLTLLPSLGGSSAALAINERGQVVGWDSGRDHRSLAVIWEHGRVRALDRRFSEAHAISDSGVIVGLCGPYRPGFPCVWENGRVTLLPTRSGATHLDVSNKRMVVATLDTCGDPAKGCTDAMLTVHLWRWQPAK